MTRSSRQLWFSKAGIVAGEYWRLWTVTLVHDPSDPLHLIFNMFALYIAGTIVERWYGSLRFLAIYLACAAAGSTASLVFGSGVPSIGASGAIMGLFGVLLAAGRIHHPVDREARAMASRLVIFVAITLGFGLISGGAVDNAAHVGGLIAGLWLGAHRAADRRSDTLLAVAPAGRVAVGGGPRRRAGVRPRAGPRGRGRRGGRRRRDRDEAGRTVIPRSDAARRRARSSASRRLSRWAARSCVSVGCGHSTCRCLGQQGRRQRRGDRGIVRDR